MLPQNCFSAFSVIYDNEVGVYYTNSEVKGTVIYKAKKDVCISSCHVSLRGVVTVKNKSVSHYSFINDEVN